MFADVPSRISKFPSEMPSIIRCFFSGGWCIYHTRCPIIEPAYLIEKWAFFAKGAEVLSFTVKMGTCHPSPRLKRSWARKRAKKFFRKINQHTWEEKRTQQTVSLKIIPHPLFHQILCMCIDSNRSKVNSSLSNAGRYWNERFSRLGFQGMLVINRLTPLNDSLNQYPPAGAYKNTIRADPITSNFLIFTTCEAARALRTEYVPDCRSALPSGVSLKLPSKTK